MNWGGDSAVPPCRISERLPGVPPLTYSQSLQFWTAVTTAHTRQPSADAPRLPPSGPIELTAAAPPTNLPAAPAPLRHVSGCSFQCAHLRIKEPIAAS